MDHPPHNPRVLWISDYPIEWHHDHPLDYELGRMHPRSWQRVLFDELMASGEIDLHILVLRKSVRQDADFEFKGATFHLRKSPGFVRLPSLFWVDTWVCKKLIPKINPDVVHAWGAERGEGMVASRLGKPHLVTVQGLLRWYNRTGFADRYTKIAALLEHANYRKANAITTESNFSVKYVNDNFDVNQVRKVEHAPGWRFHEVNRNPTRDTVRLIYVGTHTPLKGFDVLVDAFARVAVESTEVELHAFGGGNPAFIESCLTDLPEATRSRMRLHGQVPHGAILAAFETGTALVFPTRADTSPNAVKEAAVAGLPVVASNVGGIPDYIFDGKNGFLCETGSAESLYTGIKRLLESDRFRRGEVCADTLTRVRKDLSPGKMKESFVSLYRELAG